MAENRERGRFVKGAIKNRRLIYFVMAVLVLFGVYGLMKINKDEFPSFEIQEGLVVGVYPGASAVEVENRLTKPLEELLFTYSEVDRETYSYSRDGICYINVVLDTPSEKTDEVWSKIRHGLEAKKQTLPTGVLAVMVMDDFSSISSVLIALESPDKDYSEMKKCADELCDRLRELDDLSYARLYGDRSEEFAVHIDMEKLSAYGISLSSLMLDYQLSGMQIMSGTFQTDYTRSPIYVSGLTNSEREIAEKIVYSDPSGNVVRLGDIATIERRYEDASSLVKYNGRTALVISVEMRPDNNIVAFGEEVDEILAEFSRTMPASITISRITDQPKVVGTSVWSFVRDLVISMIVVILVMLLLYPVRSALIAGAGVPICIAATLAVMYMANMNLNTVTLAALIAVLGMIVDDAIITMDGYMEYLRQGQKRIEAASLSTNELFMPMSTATFAIGFMLFPIIVEITGYLGEFVQSFPWIILISLAFSLIYALTVVPSLEVKFITSAKGGTGRLSLGQEKFFNFIQKGYDSLENLCFNHPYATIFVGIVTVVLGGLMFTQLNVQMMPEAERDCFAVEMYLDANSGMARTEAVSDSLQNILLADKRVTSVTAFIGSGSPRFHALYAPKLPGKNFGQLIVNTVSNEATVELLREYGPKYEDYFPEAQIRFKQIDYQAVTAPIDVVFKGSDLQQLMPFVDSLKGFMNSRPDLMKWVHSDMDDCVASINVNLDPVEASRLGVNKTLLALNLAGIFDGASIGEVWEDDVRIPIVLYSNAVNDVMTYDVVENQMIGTAIPGVNVPLRQVANVTPAWQSETIAHIGGVRKISVMSDMAVGKSQPEGMRLVENYVDEHIRPNLPEDVKIEYAGLNGLNDQLVPELVMSVALAVLILFAFMMVHFRKISLALLTIAMSLLCLFGAFFGLWLFRLDFGITSVLGVISLVGITVKNGIVVFEEAEVLRCKQGYSAKEAGALAGKRRMRPIFIASCTTALGVLPMIIAGNSLWQPMGVVICFGIVLSIVLLVLIMPVSYWQLFKNAKEEVIDENE